MTDKQKLAARWLNEYNFNRQIAKREQDPVRKAYYLKQAKEAMQEYKQLTKA